MPARGAFRAESWWTSAFTAACNCPPPDAPPSPAGLVDHRGAHRPHERLPARSLRACRPAPAAPDLGRTSMASPPAEAKARATPAAVPSPRHRLDPLLPLPGMVGSQRASLVSRMPSASAGTIRRSASSATATLEFHFPISPPESRGNSHFSQDAARARCFHAFFITRPARPAGCQGTRRPDGRHRKITPKHGKLRPISSSSSHGNQSTRSAVSRSTRWISPIPTGKAEFDLRRRGLRPLLQTVSQSRESRLTSCVPARHYLFNEDLGLLGKVSRQDPHRTATTVVPANPSTPSNATRDASGRAKYAGTDRLRLKYLVGAGAIRGTCMARYYYMRRGAFVAAANHANSPSPTIQNSPMREALHIMVNAYDAMGLKGYSATTPEACWISISPTARSLRATRAEGRQPGGRSGRHRCSNLDVSSPRMYCDDPWSHRA